MNRVIDFPFEHFLDHSPNHGIEIRDLHVSVGSRRILEIPQLRIPKTGVIAMMGPSGCGKSTLLKALASLHEDSVRVDGHIDVRCCAEEVRIPSSRFAMIWQQPTVFPCSVYDNLKIPLRKRGIARGEWPAQMSHALEQTGLLTELGSAWPRVNAQTLSGGQQQRLCIAMGLLKNADILLFDEPTSALDPISTEKIERIMTRLGREKLVLLVTHSVGQAKRLSEYTAMFCCVNNVGQLCEYGATQQIFQMPRSEQSRRFIQLEVG
jgi:phosphate transport system ATP-binding protein